MTTNTVEASSRSLDTRSYGWGLKYNGKGKLPEAGKQYESIIAKHNAFYIDKTTTKRIYLTFDAGYENGFTDQILNVLKKQRVSATFFLVGDYLNKEEDLVKRMVKEGHIIGNHTYKHRDLTKLNKAEYKEQVEKWEQRYKELIGKDPMKIIRPPEGTFSDQSLQYADDLGYYTILWSLAYYDWDKDKQQGWEYAYNNVMNKIHPGAVILMHSTSKDNADALEKLIIGLRKDGYEFVPITKLIMSENLFVSNN
jgi:peptidoglycan-N-acetylmuramic acid deacetylase